jgi:formylglycine-generating enzyme required for sulfatase activity
MDDERPAQRERMNQRQRMSCGAWAICIICLTACWAPGTRQESVAGEPSAELEPPPRLPDAIRTSIGLTMIPVPHGSFRMGTQGHPTWEQSHEVSITRSYWMAETEVTQRQWFEVMRTQPWIDGPVVGDDLPAVNVSWHEAVEFCERLDKRERTLGKIPAGYAIKLPSEAEWERACRAGSDRDFCFGDEWERLSEYAVWRGNSNRYAEQVKSKKPNAFGLYDMHGNAWEWCADAFDPDLTDATDPLREQGDTRSRRGGSADCESRLCRSAQRDCNSPEAAYLYIGFRPALVQR